MKIHVLRQKLYLTLLFAGSCQGLRGAQDSLSPEGYAAQMKNAVETNNNEKQEEMIYLACQQSWWKSSDAAKQIILRNVLQYVNQPAQDRRPINPKAKEVVQKSYNGQLFGNGCSLVYYYLRLCLDGCILVDTDPLMAYLTEELCKDELNKPIWPDKKEDLTFGECLLMHAAISEHRENRGPAARLYEKLFKTDLIQKPDLSREIPPALVKGKKGLTLADVLWQADLPADLKKELGIKMPVLKIILGFTILAVVIASPVVVVVMVGKKIASLRKKKATAAEL